MSGLYYPTGHPSNLNFHLCSDAVKSRSTCNCDCVFFPFLCAWLIVCPLKDDLPMWGELIQITAIQGYTLGRGDTVGNSCPVLCMVFTIRTFSHHDHMDQSDLQAIMSLM